MVNPTNKPGRVTLITRMSAQHLREHLPKLIRAVQDAGLNVSEPLLVRASRIFRPGLGVKPSHEPSRLLGDFVSVQAGVNVLRR